MDNVENYSLYIFFHILLPRFKDKLLAATEMMTLVLSATVMGCDEVFVCVGVLFMQSSVKKSKCPRTDLYKSTYFSNPTMRKKS